MGTTGRSNIDFSGLLSTIVTAENRIAVIPSPRSRESGDGTGARNRGVTGESTGPLRVPIPIGRAAGYGISRDSATGTTTGIALTESVGTSTDTLPSRPPAPTRGHAPRGTHRHQAPTGTHPSQASHGPRVTHRSQRSQGSQAAQGPQGPVPTQSPALSSILLPRPGGFPEEIFTDLTEEEKKDWECAICYLLVRGAKRCNNGHLFCATCILTWSVSVSTARGSATRGSCPVCRDQGVYRPDLPLDRKLARKHVTCPEVGCTWKGTLREYRSHARSHGREEGHDLGEEPEVEGTRLRNAGTQYPSARAMRFAAQGTSGGSSSILTDSENQSYSQFDTRITRGRRRLEQLFDSFNTRLQRRGRDIDEFYQQRERARREQLREVTELGRRLGEVSSDLMYLLGNMNRDSERYQSYIRQSENIESAMQELTDTISTLPTRNNGTVTSQSTGGTMTSHTRTMTSRAGTMTSPPTSNLTLPALNTTSRLTVASRSNRVTRVRQRPLATRSITSREPGAIIGGSSSLLSMVRGHNTELSRPGLVHADRSRTVTQSCTTSTTTTEDRNQTNVTKTIRIPSMTDTRTNRK